MNANGMDILPKHIPELNSASGKVRIVLYVIFLFTTVTAYFISTDRIPTWSIDSQIIVTTLGFLVLSLFFSRKQAYKEKYKELAYCNAFAHYGMPGLALILSAIAHAGYMNGPIIPHGWWTIVFFAASWFMLCMGALIWIRSVFAFGVDNLALLYVYRPEEGKLSTPAFTASCAIQFMRESCAWGSDLHCSTAMPTQSRLPFLCRLDSRAGFVSWRKRID